MEAIEKMAALCMKDLDEDDGVEEEGLEDDDELMVIIPWDLVTPGHYKTYYVRGGNERNVVRNRIS